jgi:hypothetical protein
VGMTMPRLALTTSAGWAIGLNRLQPPRLTRPHSPSAAPYAPTVTSATWTSKSCMRAPMRLQVALTDCLGDGGRRWLATCGSVRTGSLRTAGRRRKPDRPCPRTAGRLPHRCEIRALPPCCFPLGGVQNRSHTGSSSTEVNGRIYVTVLGRRGPREIGALLRPERHRQRVWQRGRR